ncbi:uncharacterized protein SAPINGB_P006252 [Magnusiomyces paraingens]|uniref:ML-like domain-containing protein n=1 Tax=Magnusiomyces paraingens TaxID=2606893 RepID=A0A5E8C406_9ASCO|nr:uncharacterized protein SAPINGB_P006252 [Saprochaete ingens]VVT58524.1 unnamed protein product [Saprochaete ingens]
MLRIHKLFLALIFSSSLILPALAERILRSSALLTCMDNSQFSASKFDVTFTPNNKTVTFDLNAVTTLDGYFVAKIVVIAYGISVITQTINFCNLGSDTSQLCPISPGHLDNLKGTYTIDSDIVNQIPGVTYTIPDLDGIVQVLVYPNGTTDSSAVACVEATLTNDKTVQTPYASWALAIVTIVGFLLAGVVWLRGSLSSSAHISSNIVSLFIYFQGVAIIAMMAVERCPHIAAAWSQNFMWTVGLISLPFIQDIMNWYIQATGGTVTSILPNADLMNLSIQKRAIYEYATQIYSTLDNPTVRPFVLAAKSAFIPRDVAYFLQLPSLLDDPWLFVRDDETSTETTDEKLDDYSSTVLVLRGMQRVAFLANIEITSVFVTGITFFLIFLVFAMIILLFIKTLTEMLAKTNLIHRGRVGDFRKEWKSIFKGVLLRVFFMAFPSLTVLCLWEFTQHESVATVVLAVFTYLTVVALLAFGAYKTISTARRSMQTHKNPAYLLFSDVHMLNRWGVLYVNFRASAYYFITPMLIHVFIKGAFIAFAQGSGKVQGICVFLIELFYLIYVAWVKPYMDKPTNGFNIAIAAVSMINALFFLFFSNLFGQPAYVSSIMAVIFFVLNAAFSLVLVVLIIVSCMWAIFSRNPENRYEPMRDDRESFIPDPEGEKKPVTELDALGATARDGYPNTLSVMTSLSGVKPESMLTGEDLMRGTGSYNGGGSGSGGGSGGGSGSGGSGSSTIHEDGSIARGYYDEDSFYDNGPAMAQGSSSNLIRPQQTNNSVYPIDSRVSTNSATALTSIMPSQGFPSARLPRAPGGHSEADMYSTNTAYPGPGGYQGRSGW